jgi:hypothetical protein
MHAPLQARLVLALVGAAGSAALADNYTVPGQKYHAQVTDHYCASASVQMMLDCTAVRGANGYIDTFLSAPDPAPIAPDGPFHNQAIPPQPTYVGGQVTFAPQVAIYNLLHNHAVYTPVAGPYTGVALSYNNPFCPWPTTGSGNNAMQWVLNVLDNSAIGGNGNHQYVAYNVPPTIPWGDWASRTIANALHDYGVAAEVTIGRGAHAITVVGYTTIGTPARNQPYKITGFYVDDPWTGYAKARNLPNNLEGLGVHAWVKYGWSRSPVAPVVNVPGVGLVQARPAEWFRYFNPAPGFAGEGASMSGTGFKFVVEPQGPEALDDGNGGLLDSVPPLAPLLPAPLDAAGAVAAAQAAVTTGDLQGEDGLTGGAFDPANVTLMDPADERDWLVPYEIGGQYTGAVLVDSYTGEIEQAMWVDQGEAVSSFTLAEIQTMYTDIYSDLLPDGNPAPCYANCDGSTADPVLNALDFACFLDKFAQGDTYANCDESTTPPVLNVLDFACFINKFAAGCP